VVVFHNFFGPTSTLYELSSIDLTEVSFSPLVVSPHKKEEEVSKKLIYKENEEQGSCILCNAT